MRAYNEWRDLKTVIAGALQEETIQSYQVHDEALSNQVLRQLIAENQMGRQVKHYQ